MQHDRLSSHLLRYSFSILYISDIFVLQDLWRMCCVVQMCFWYCISLILANVMRVLHLCRSLHSSESINSQLNYAEVKGHTLIMGSISLPNKNHFYSYPSMPWYNEKIRALYADRVDSSIFSYPLYIYSTNIFHSPVQTMHLIIRFFWGAASGLQFVHLYTALYGHEYVISGGSHFWGPHFLGEWAHLTFSPPGKTVKIDLTCGGVCPVDTPWMSCETPLQRNMVKPWQ